MNSLSRPMNAGPGSGRAQAGRTKDDPVHGAVRREVLEGVGRLDLAAAARRGALQDVEHAQVEDGAADDRVPARRGPRCGFSTSPAIRTTPSSPAGSTAAQP